MTNFLGFPFISEGCFLYRILDSFYIFSALEKYCSIASWPPWVWWQIWCHSNCFFLYRDSVAFLWLLSRFFFFVFFSILMKMYLDTTDLCSLCLGFVELLESTGLYPLPNLRLFIHYVFKKFSTPFAIIPQVPEILFTVYSIPHPHPLPRCSGWIICIDVFNFTDTFLCHLLCYWDHAVNFYN